LFRVTTSFVERALTWVVLEEDSRQKILLIATSRLEEARKLAQDELQKILSDEKKQPITYNHYYTDNIQNAREDSLKKLNSEGRARSSDGRFQWKIPR